MDASAVACSYDELHNALQNGLIDLAFHGEVLYTRSLDEAHMMVAANRGVLLIELREEGASTGPVVCRVPVMAADGIMRSDYYAF